jgi:hypothetical protein
VAPVAEGSLMFSANISPKIGGMRSRPVNQAVWPSNSPVLGIFFACCGVIFAVS